MTDCIPKAERSVWKQERCILLPIKTDEGHEDSFCSKKPGFAFAYIFQGCPVSNFGIKVANFPMLRAIFISYILAFSQSDVAAFAHLCPLLSKLWWTWPCYMPFPQLFMPPAALLCWHTCLPLDYQEAQHPFWGIWDATHTGGTVSRVLLCNCLIPSLTEVPRRLEDVWTVISGMRSR